MFNLLFTCIVTLLPFLPFAAKAQNVVVSEEVNIVDVNPLVKNAFIDEIDGENEIAYVYTLTDIAYAPSFFDICTYFETYISGFEVYDDDEYMPVGTVYSLPIRECTLRTIYNFDYAAGWPYHLGYISTFNAIKIKKTGHPSGNIAYQVGFTYSINDNIDSILTFNYRKSEDFDYVLGCDIYFHGNHFDANEFCIAGNTAQGDLMIPSLMDILGSVGDRYHGDYSKGYENGYNNGLSKGYQTGYQQGLDDADYNTTASTIFNGIFEVGLLPVNVFLTIFNFEVFGINIAGIISGLLTLSVVVIIVRFLLGGKKDD